MTTAEGRVVTDVNRGTDRPLHHGFDLGFRSQEQPQYVQRSLQQEQRVLSYQLRQLLQQLQQLVV